jgi:hypothetical protein
MAVEKERETNIMELANLTPPPRLAIIILMIRNATRWEVFFLIFFSLSVSLVRI